MRPIKCPNVWTCQLFTLRRRDIEQPSRSLESPFMIPGLVLRTYTVLMCARMLSNVNSKWGLTCPTESTLLIIIYYAWLYVCMLTPTGYKICVNLHGSGPCTMGITLVIVQPVWRTFKSLSNIRWNGNTWQNVAGLIFGSTKT